MITIDQALEEYRKSTPDIAEHLGTLTELASRVNTITEFGFRFGCSFAALLKGLGGRPGTKATTYDLHIRPVDVDLFGPMRGETELEFNQISTIDTPPIDQTDLLFIDSLHTHLQLQTELKIHAHKVNKYIVMHDTETYGRKGETGAPIGLRDAVEEFLVKNPEWSVEFDHKNCNGLMCLVKKN